MKYCIQIICEITINNDLEQKIRDDDIIDSTALNSAVDKKDKSNMNIAIDIIKATFSNYIGKDKNKCVTKIIQGLNMEVDAGPVCGETLQSVADLKKNNVQYKNGIDVFP